MRRTWSRRDSAARRAAQARSLFDLQTWVLSYAPSTWLVDLEPYEPCRVVGAVRKLRIDPGGNVIEADITDGTGETTARWPLRYPTPELAIAPGRGVVLEGISTRDAHGLVVFEEPRFTVVELARAGGSDDE